MPWFEQTNSGPSQLGRMAGKSRATVSLVLCSHRHRMPQACTALQSTHLPLAWQNSRHLQEETQLGAVLAQAAHTIPPLPGILIRATLAAASCSSTIAKCLGPTGVLLCTSLNAALCSTVALCLHRLADAR